ncbi:MAG: hypothetical protein HY319_22820 [Armatimonadetes bacterium]|nr:hypothetical protein [Armatimonadota bacterium]
MELKDVRMGELKTYRNERTGFSCRLKGDGIVDEEIAQQYLREKPGDSFVPCIFDERVAGLVKDCANLAARFDAAGDAKYPQSTGQAEPEFSKALASALPDWDHPLISYHTDVAGEWKISADSHTGNEGSIHQFLTVDTGPRHEVWMRTNANPGRPEVVPYCHWVSAQYDPATCRIIEETVKESLTA